jgi:hypothetical protein
MSRVVPIAKPNISTVVAGDAATVDDDAKEDEAQHGEDLDDAEHEFD